MHFAPGINHHFFCCFFATEMWGNNRFGKSIFQQSLGYLKAFLCFPMKVVLVVSITISKWYWHALTITTVSRKAFYGLGCLHKYAVLQLSFLMTACIQQFHCEFERKFRFKWDFSSSLLCIKILSNAIYWLKIISFHFEEIKPYFFYSTDGFLVNVSVFGNYNPLTLCVYLWDT